MDERGGRVLSFKEKPQAGEGWINGGFFVLNARAVEYVDGDQSVWERDAVEGKVHARERHRAITVHQRWDAESHRLGFGLRDVEKNFPASEDTLFAIGSSSKAFTSLLCAMMVDEGKMSWDTPVVAYLPGFTLADGAARLLYFDRQYNDTLGLMHESAHKDSVPLSLDGVDRRVIDARLLTPLDLAISKIGRLSDQDRDDIALLARRGLVDPMKLRKRAQEAAAGYVGDMERLRNSIDIACRIAEDASRRAR